MLSDYRQVSSIFFAFKVEQMTVSLPIAGMCVPVYVHVILSNYYLVLLAAI